MTDDLTQLHHLVHVSLDEGWDKTRRITLVEGALHAPDLPDVAGLYCLVFEQRKRYFGEAGDLRRRIGDYLLYYAATGIESEFRINKALLQHHGAELWIVTNESGALNKRSDRCKVESRLIKQAKANNITVLNGGSVPEKIAFHAAEIIRLSAKLKQPPVPGDQQ